MPNIAAAHLGKLLGADGPEPSGGDADTHKQRLGTAMPRLVTVGNLLRVWSNAQLTKAGRAHKLQRPTRRLGARRRRQWGSCRSPIGRQEPSPESDHYGSTLYALVWWGGRRIARRDTEFLSEFAHLKEDELREISPHCQ
ncbi:uncharacterized protein Tco025E_08892 [Trypanosoma conorhini]|uniref:Uncharacterized protein n=1 Tax=Trypanosoma conorhini TaxID=83891 RepID=A0A3R7NBI6_9TRYP|nr:uncharacterized protein Tco025E_08892 [Trypanosoma conorhini]RNF00060.1 hypothetical protein Tco025E_08892 [Trypanosoma conorhini]